MDRRELDLLGLCALIEERSRSWEVKRPDVALDAMKPITSLVAGVCSLL